MAEEEKQETINTHIFGLRTTANREDQVLDFVSSNADKKKFNVHSIIRAHGMRGYIFLEADTKQDAEQAAFNIPYARGILPKEIDYKEIEHMLETVKVEMNIIKSDIVEIISGPFKREQAKVTRIDKVKEEVVVELLEAAVPIPITVKMDAVKVIRRESEEDEEQEEDIPVHIPSPKKDEKPIEFAVEEDGGLPMPGTQEKSDSAQEKAEENEEADEEEPAKEEEPPLPEEKESIKEKVEDVVEDVKEVVEKVEEKLHIKKKPSSESEKGLEESKTLQKKESAEKEKKEETPKEEKPEEEAKEE